MEITIKQSLKEIGMMKFFSKTVEYLVGNTQVDEFNPNSFQGYQRKINSNHCRKIMKYIKESLESNSFYFPTPIICSKRDEKSPLYIVDGQHRIEAMKLLYKEEPNVFEKIKQYELGVIVLENPSIAQEIETFITINKTSRKVDTSLALVLKTSISGGDEATILSKKQYVLVQLATILNSTKESSFYNQISFEGTPQSTGKLISLSTFVRAVLPLLNIVIYKQLITLEKLDNDVKILKEIFDVYWNSLEELWPKILKSENISQKKILQGAIGISSTIQFLQIIIREKVSSDLDELKGEIEKAISDIKIDENRWLPGQEFSNYSSARGHSFIASILLKSIREK